MIYNPAAGRGRAERWLHDARDSLGGIELMPTSRAGHATELAREAADRGFAKVIAAGGDGTVHEVANGLLQSGNRDAVFSTWPIGSANDYAYTLGMQQWWKRRSEPTAVLEVDVGRITASGREQFYVNALGIGFNGMVTLESRGIRGLTGVPLYTWAFLKAMVKHFRTPPLRVRFDERETNGPTLALTINLAQREGGFPITPRADLTDGHFDYLHATKLRRWHLVRYLPAMIRGTLPEDHPLLHTGRAARITAAADEPLCIHADGEFFCTPADGIREVTIEVLPKRLKVEVFPPALYGGRR
ncbi:MAG: diacylglycerol kinase family protein [Gemmataceae bacterium]